MEPIASLKNILVDFRGPINVLSWNLIEPSEPIPQSIEGRIAYKLHLNYTRVFRPRLNSSVTIRLPKSVPQSKLGTLDLDPLLLGQMKALFANRFPHSRELADV